MLVMLHLVVLSGCATRQPAISSAPGALASTNGVSLPFRAAVIARDSTPATYSFQKARGKLGSAKEGLTDAAEIAVTGPALGIIVPGVIIGETIRSAPDEGAVLFGAALAGAAGGVAVAGAAVVIPAVAAKGVIRSWKTVSPQELAEREADLQIALKEVAAQERFQQFLLATADKVSPGRLDLSSEMIKYARIRRGLDLVHANARALPFGDGSYRTLIYATGVVDFIGDEEGIRVIMNEARRVVHLSGNIFVAFYRLSAATERFLIRLDLLQNNVLCHREVLEIYRLNPAQAMAWVAKRANVSYFRATIMSLRSWAFSTWQEKRNGFHMQRLFAKGNHADTLIEAAPQKQPYRNEAEIRHLFARLAIPIKQLRTFSSCHIVRI